MRRTIKKTIALFLTVVMLFALAVPMVNATEPEGETIYPYDEAQNGQLVGKLDFGELADTNITAKDGTTVATTSFANNLVIRRGYDSSYGDGTSVLFASRNAKGHMATIGTELSDLPLNSDSVYTVEFNMGANNTNTYGLFLTQPTNTGFCISGWENTYLAKTADWTIDWDHYVNTQSMDSADVAFKGKIVKELTCDDNVTYSMKAYRVVIDAPNKVMKIYKMMSNGTYALCMTMNDYVPNTESGKLGLYFGAYTMTGWHKFVFSDVKIYKGANYEYVTVEENGAKLLTLGDMSTSQNGELGVTYTPNIAYDKSSYDYDKTYDENKAAVKYTYTDGVHSLAETNTYDSYREFGGTTNLLLGKDQKYTVKYLCSASKSVGITFASSALRMSQTVYLSKVGEEVKLTVTRADSTSADAMLHDFVTLDTSIFNADGYAEVAVEIDGYQLTVYINGEEKLSCGVFSTTLKKFISYGFSGDLLTLAINEQVTEGTAASSFKDIELYSGLVMSYNYVKAIEGSEYEYLKLDKSERTYTLPEAAKKGHMFKGYLVNDSDEITKVGESFAVAELEQIEKVFVPVMSEHWWHSAKIYEEDGVTDTGKRNVRIVSAVDSLDYSAIGYNVTIKYQDKSFDKNNFNLKYVYNSLLASYGAEVVTLDTLGYDGDGYITAFVIKNVPTDVGDITVEITPYQVSIDGETRTEGVKTTIVLGANDLD